MTAEDEGREPQIAALLRTVNVGPNQEIGIRRLSELTGISRVKIRRLLSPIIVGQKREFTDDTAPKLAATLPLDLDLIQITLEADTRYSVYGDTTTLQMMLEAMPGMSRRDVATVLRAATNRLASDDGSNEQAEGTPGRDTGDQAREEDVRRDE